MRVRHKKYIKRIHKKDKIRVVFLITHSNLWKLDLLYKKMDDDPYFEPIVLVCPTLSKDKMDVQRTIEFTYAYFNKKGFRAIKARNSIEEDYLELGELNTDIVFFTSPHKITISKYYKDAYSQHLSCFAGYGYIAREYNYYDPNLDKWFHQALWRNYASDEYSYKRFKNNSLLKGVNTKLTGAVYAEELLRADKKASTLESDKRKKIIYAPHYTIYEKQGFKLSNFIELSGYMLQLRERYSDYVYWIFRPHPHLFDALLTHPDWGRKKTEDYFNAWKGSDGISMLSDGDYIQLFKESDAIIHDSGSFLVEYLTQKKPSLYIINNKTTNVFNSLYRRAYSASYHATSEDDIDRFVDNVISDSIKIKAEHENFYNAEFVDQYLTDSPSDKIMSDIKKEISNETGNY